VTSQPIAPVIPSRARAAARAGGRAGTVQRLLLAAVLEVPFLPDEVVYGFGRMDVSGRVGDRAIVSVLGWQPGDRLTLTGTAGVTIVRRDPGGLVPCRCWVRHGGSGDGRMPRSLCCAINPLWLSVSGLAFIRV
jgi:hypothetical protein